MRMFLLGLACGVALTATTAVYASDTIQAYLFPARYVVNGQEKTLDNDYTTLNYNGHAYVPVRFVAESLSANVAYEDETKSIIVKSGNLDITDPSDKFVTVGNLILTKDGNNTTVSGQVKIDNAALPGTNKLGANLEFCNEKGEQIGSVAISGDFNEGVHTFESTGKGDFRNYSSVKLNVGYLNGMIRNMPPQDIDKTVTISTNTAIFEQAGSDSKKLGELAPQTVKAFQQWYNWYHIHTWLGDGWVYIVDSITN